eukprot:2822319-Pyramimonas_sp.AAC.2
MFIDSDLLVDADAVAHDAQGAVLRDPAAGDHLALALPLEVHHAQVRDGAEVGVRVEHLHVAAARVRHRVQPHHLLRQPLL